MSIFLGNYGYLMGNWVGLYNLPDCANNAKFETGFFLQLDLKLDPAPPVYTLGCCTGRTFVGDIGTSGRMMCGPERDMWTLR